MAAGKVRRSKNCVPKQKAIAESVSLRGVFHPFLSARRQLRDMADALSVAGVLGGTRRPLVSALPGRIFQCLDLARKPLGTEQAWVAAWRLNEAALSIGISAL